MNRKLATNSRQNWRNKAVSGVTTRNEKVGVMRETLLARVGQTHSNPCPAVLKAAYLLLLSVCVGGLRQTRDKPFESVGARA